MLAVGDGTQTLCGQTGFRWNHSMSEIVFEISGDITEGGFVARARGHSIVTEAGTWEELRVNVREAVLCHFDKGRAPAVISLIAQARG